MLYKNWLNEWLNNYIKISSKNRTYIRYKQIINTHISPILGDYDINDLSSLIIQKYINKLIESGNLKTSKGLAPNSVNSIINVIEGSLNLAYKLHFLSNNITANIVRPTNIEKKIESFSINEQNTIEKYIENSNKSYLIGIVICLYTGLRIGELLALEWDDIDFSDGTLYVRKSSYDGWDSNNKFTKFIDTPKTKSSVREIPLSNILLKVLRIYKKDSNCSFVISKNDKPIFTRTYQKIFSSLLVKLNISHKGFHSLRHTFATRAIESGMDVKTLSEILGHKDPIVTLNRYAHSMIKHKKEAMNNLVKYVKKDHQL